MNNFREAWDYGYGSKSHMNLAGKIIIGVPMFPVVFFMVAMWTLLDFLFTKEGKK